MVLWIRTITRRGRHVNEGAAMGGAYLLIAEEAWRLAKALPFPVVQAVIARLGRSDGTDLGNVASRDRTGPPEPPPTGRS